MIGADNFIQLAIDEILRTYGDRVVVNRKSLLKYGENIDLDTDVEEEISYKVGNETYLSTNGITVVSSSDAGDTAQITIECMTISSNILTFVSQTATLNGQSDVTLTTPLASAANNVIAFAGFDGFFADIIS